MTKRTTTEITVEMDELLVITRRDRFTRGYCETCAAEVLLVTISQAASIANMGELEIAVQIKSSVLHATKATTGRILICLDSLLK